MIKSSDNGLIALLFVNFHTKISENLGKIINKFKKIKVDNFLSAFSFFRGLK